MIGIGGIFEVSRKILNWHKLVEFFKGIQVVWLTLRIKDSWNN